MLIDPPQAAWYRPSESPLALAVEMRVRDLATARALSAYLATRADVPATTTLEVNI